MNKQQLRQLVSACGGDESILGDILGSFHDQNPVGNGRHVVVGIDASTGLPLLAPANGGGGYPAPPGRGGGGGVSPQVAQMLAAMGEKPAWRGTQVAPGANVPREHRQPLPFTPDNGTGSFVAAGPASIQFDARVQRSFAGGRMFANIYRTGATAAGQIVFANTFSVGAENQFVQNARFDLASIAPTSFGAGLEMTGAIPGIDISLTTTLQGVALAGADQVTVTISSIGPAIAS